jgi:hypothetical protein
MRRSSRIVQIDDPEGAVNVRDCRELSMNRQGLHTANLGPDAANLSCGRVSEFEFPFVIPKQESEIRGRHTNYWRPSPSGAPENRSV